MSSFSITGRNALVTGGAQGLGEALSERLAAEGCNIAICDVQGPRCEEVARRLDATYGVKTLAGAVDVTCEKHVGSFVDRTVEALGSLDVLVSNAGILKAHPVEEFPVEEWRRIIDINLVGYFICAKHAARVMVPRKSGTIIQINSKSGKRGSFKNSAYAASKFGGIGLTQSVALELAPFGIRVNAICPGNLLDSPLWVDSLYKQYAQRLNMTVEEVRQKYEGQVPMGRGCAYDDVADVMVFLASDASSYMTGQAINVTGGQEMH